MWFCTEDQRRGLHRGWRVESGKSVTSYSEDSLPGTGLDMTDPSEPAPQHPDLGARSSCLLSQESEWVRSLVKGYSVENAMLRGFGVVGNIGTIWRYLLEFSLRTQQEKILHK